MAVTITEENYKTVKKITFSWVSDASGDASGTTTNYYSGQIVTLVCTPSTGGSAPDSEYLMQIFDGDNVDALEWPGIYFLNSEGLSVLSTENSNQLITRTSYSGQTDSQYLGCILNDRLTLTISNAGDTKSGTVIIYVR